MQLFSEEFLREMNLKADLIRKTEALRQSDNLQYSKLIDKHKVEYRRLHVLPIGRLRMVASDIGRKIE